MLTHQIIKSEINSLRESLEKGDVAIPTLWEGMKLGVIIMLWMIVCPLVMAFFFKQEQSDVLISLGGGVFLGFIVLFNITNLRNLYLSLPGSFREKSKVVKMFNHKVKLYGSIYMIAIFLFSFLGGGVYLGGVLLTTVVLSFVFYMDIGRYQLTGIITLLESFIKKKNTM